MLMGLPCKCYHFQLSIHYYLCLLKFHNLNSRFKMAAMLDERSSKGTFLQLPQWATKTSDQSTQVLVRKPMETKSKILDVSHRKIGWFDPGICPLIDGNEIKDGSRNANVDERRSWSSKGSFLYSPPMSHIIIWSTDPGDGNQIQDGGHRGWAAELIIERNFPLVTPNISHRKIAERRKNTPFP
jgi:hypothetical protein